MLIINDLHRTWLTLSAELNPRAGNHKEHYNRPGNS